MLLKKLLTLLFLSLFLTACTISTDETPTDDNPIPDSTVSIPDLTTLGYDSFQTASEAALNDNEAKTLVLSGTAVQNRSGISSNAGAVETPLLSLTFDETGGMSGVSLYADDQDYTVATSSVSTSYGYFLGIVSGGGTGSIVVDREFENVQNSDNYFVAEYMVNVDWGVLSGINYYAGKMIVGFETTGNDIVNTGEVTFMGNGVGRYSLNDAEESVEFNVTADVNFGAREVSLTTTDTGYCPEGVDCTDAKNSYVYLASLNFTSALTYDAALNNISGNVSTDGMNGAAQARFYGTGDNAAKELGGTFYLTQGDLAQEGSRFYIGNFGAKRGDIVETVEPVEPPALNVNNLESFVDDDRNGTKNNALQVATAVQITKNWENGTITSNKITDAVVAFDYIEEGDFASGGSLRLYFDGKQHITGSTALGDSDSIAYYVADNLSDDTFDGLELSKGSKYFDFTADYMALIYWRLDRGTLDDTHGYAIAGYETKFADIPTTEANISFTGKGRGKYHHLENVDSTYFDVTAIVDFTSENINLSSTNTCTQSSAEYCNSSYATYWKPHLDFTATSLSYVAPSDAEGETAITGTIETAGDVGSNIAKLTGTADARFYGTDAGVATELGGTFNMVNANAAYVGWFGAKRGYEPIMPEEPMMPNLMIDNNIIGGIINGNAPALNANSLESFVDVARYDTTDNGFTVASAVLIGKNTTTNIISANNIENAIVAFDYQADGVFDKMQLYFTDKDYSTTTANNNTTNNKVDFLINHYIDVSDGSDEPHQVGVSKGAFSLGFDAEYMVRIYWQIGEAKHDYATYGYGIAGFETDGMNIPTTTGIVNFTGKGNGRYYNSDSGKTSSSWPSTITADVDFDARNVYVTGKVSTSPHSLDFTGNLGYAANTNILTGTDWATTGDTAKPQLTGTAQARFYGTGADAAIELGGTFNLTNAGAAYAGWFGARNDDFIPPPPPAEPSAPSVGVPNIATGAPDITHGKYDSITAATAMAGNFYDTDKVFILRGFGVRAENANVDNLVTTTTEIANYQTALQLTIDYFPVITKADLYIDNSQHSIASTTGTATTLSEGIIGKTSSEILNVNRSFSDSYTADYMVAASWTYEPTAPNTSHQGFMVAGMETNASNIPETGTATFTGAGRGLHKEFTDRYTKFDVTAAVNFSARTVGLEVKDTKNSDSNNALTDLNFTANLAYTTQKNYISGYVENVDGMNGEAHARFYGTKGTKNTGNNNFVDYDNAAKELGGTFSMKSGTAEYIGYFGAKQ